MYNYINVHIKNLQNNNHIILLEYSNYNIKFSIIGNNILNNLIKKINVLKFIKLFIANSSISRHKKYNLRSYCRLYHMYIGDLMSFVIFNY